ncbi:MAG TPA: acyl-CoA dehydrogenase family protein [Acidimicrobiales bacterium]|nr:acyl-CoA dehydrogenase family protein [Acidimicrobiales bacterium]
MDFEFDENQLGLQAAAAEVLAKECPPSYLRAVLGGDQDPADLWRTLAGLDWPALAIAAEHGGLGASAVELAIVVEQLGYVGDPTPFLATTTQFVPVVAACGDEGQRRRFLGAVASEACPGTLALAGADGRWDPRTPAVEATRAGDRWRLRGTAAFVIDGDRAAELAVLAATERGPAAFVVPAGATQVRRTPSLDQALHVAEVTFDGATVGEDRRLAGPDAAAGFERALDAAVAGLAMMTVGACQRALDMVLEYARGREQFGVPIGSFQAVKHKAVDMYVAIERARALGYFAALTIAEDDDRRSLAASMAKAAAGDAQHIVFQHGIQLFGGIGFTWENDVHLYLRRAKAGELLLGGAAAHRAKVGRSVMDGSRRATGT